MGGEARTAPPRRTRAPGSGRCPKPCRLASRAELRWRVAEKLALDWSPEQISGWLKRTFPADEGLRVSHETIYRSLFVQARGVLKKELIGHLRAGRRMRYPKGGTAPSRLPGQIIDAISSENVPLKSRSVAFQAIGKVICSRGPTTLIWLRSSSAILAS